MKKLSRFPMMLAILLLFLSVILNAFLYLKVLDSGIANDISRHSMRALVYIAKEACPNGDVWEAAYSKMGIDAQYREFDDTKDPHFVGLNPNEIEFVLAKHDDGLKNGNIIFYFNLDGCLVTGDNHG